MGLFQRIFGRRRPPQAGGFWETLTAYSPAFTSWGGELYESELVRAAIDARARNISKLAPTFVGSAQSKLRAAVRGGPNELQVWSQFLYRLSTILDMQGTAFVVPLFEHARFLQFNETEMEDQEAAAHIIDHIYKMFRAWLVGYFWIIVLETILYALIFIPFNVPFWPVLALIAGSTILLPFLGPVLAAILSVVVTVIFAQGGIVMPVIGIGIAYLLIHVILEQLLLYPVLVGEAIGLTLVETIIVVLLGAVVAGISGMILAVPAAALLKLLVPLFYQTLNARRRRKTAQAQDSADPGA